MKPELKGRAFNFELCTGLALLGAIEETFVEVTDILQPKGDGRRSKAFISKGYDATSHF